MPQDSEIDELASDFEEGDEENGNDEDEDEDEGPDGCEVDDPQAEAINHINNMEDANAQRAADGYPPVNLPE